jgi:5'-3' exonuclease
MPGAGMAMSTHLLIDSNFLAYRSYHAMGELSFGAIKTGVIYGFLKEVIGLQDRFGTDCVVFCFDLGNPKRKEIMPCYKQKRHALREMTEEARESRLFMRAQVDKLREEYLPRIGYKNIHAQWGYEADDVIASVCTTLPEGDDAIIVSADGDLYQLLSERVSIFQPKMFKRDARFITLQSFKKQHGIHPKHWARVKALAGCVSDEIPGVEGVGEKTALKFLRGELKKGSVARLAIRKAFDAGAVALNLRVVGLPYVGTQVFKLQKDELSHEGWQEVCASLGLRSLVNDSPFSSRANRHKTTAPNGFGLRKEV